MCWPPLPPAPFLRKAMVVFLLIHSSVYLHEVYSVPMIETSVSMHHKELTQSKRGSAQRLYPQNSNYFGVLPCSTWVNHDFWCIPTHSLHQKTSSFVIAECRKEHSLHKYSISPKPHKKRKIFLQKSIIFNPLYDSQRLQLIWIAEETRPRWVGWTVISMTFNSIL